MLGPWFLATIFLASLINNQSKPGRSLFMFETITLLVDNLYAKATEAVKSCAALLASTSPVIFDSG
jgi:hypothetical protein